MCVEKLVYILKFPSIVLKEMYRKYYRDFCQFQKKAHETVLYTLHFLLHSMRNFLINLSFPLILSVQVVDPTSANVVTVLDTCQTYPQEVWMCMTLVLDH